MSHTRGGRTNPIDAKRPRRISRRGFLALAGAVGGSAAAAYLGARFLSSPPSPPSLPADLDGVVIVGAGLSGLTAASDLLDAGIDVRVLEAHPWIGGRVRSRRWSNGQVTEMGAEDILDLDANLWRRIDGLGLAAEPLSPALDAYFVRGTYVPPATPTDAAFVGQIDAIPWADGSAKDAYWDFVAQTVTKDFAPPYGSAEDLALDVDTYTGYLADRGVHPDVDWFTGVNMKAELCARNQEVNALLGLDTYFYYYNARWYHLRGGNEQLPHAIASRLGGRVFTGVKVQEIVETADGVRAAYAREGAEGEIRARACVVSVQAPHVAPILPDLPPEKASALAQVRYGSYVLPQLRFSRRFWKDDYGLNTWSVNTDLATNYFVDQTYTQPGDDGILVGWIAADDAARLFSDAHHGDVTGDAKEAVVEAALGDLELVYPGARDHLVESYVTQWRHALPYFPPGYVALLPTLRAPFGRIFFCGDYTEGPGMDTAILSGERAAQQLLQAAVLAR